VVRARHLTEARVTRVVTSRLCDAEELTAVLRPRRGLVSEREAGDRRFEAERGPVDAYTRQVEVEDLPDGRFRVTEAVEYRLAIPFFGWMFGPPFRWAMRRPGGRSPWWTPPEALDARATSALAAVAVLAIVGGYVTSVLGTSVAFAAREFQAAPGEQGVAGTVVRFGVIVAMVVAAAADRRGRRAVILLALGASCVLTATGAAVPSLGWLAASQVLSRSLALGGLIAAAILVAEEVPAGSRAYAVSLLTMAAGFGAGIGVMALPLADLGPGGWRFLYLLPLAGLLLLPAAARHLPESRRYQAPHPDAHLTRHGGRFWLLAASAFLVNLLAAPSGFFLSRYLLEERAFSAAGVSLFTLAAGTPAVIGLFVGGRLADTRGRRPVGALALVVGTVTTVLVYFAAGWPMWAWSIAGSIVAAAGVPALGVYGPELFPTSLRGRTGGLLAIVGVAGSAAGLLTAGFLAEELGRFGPALAPLAVGPLLVAVLVLVAYPETARRSLEDLNPEDAAPSA
jgi:MFS family permease